MMMEVRRIANPLFNDNKLKLAVFCTNNSAIPTLAPEIGMPSIEDILTLARRADEAGFEGLVPIARWKGYLDGRPDHKLNYVLDPFVLAGTLAQTTRYSALFTTTHAPTMHPIVVAKQAATIDRLSGGRFAMNIVGGWNRREFEMFGIDLLPHDERYDYLAEWLDIIRSLWTSNEEVNFDTRFFKIKGALSRPTPVQSPPPIMNAALSASGRQFAAKNADIAFMSILDHKPDIWKTQVEEYRALARDNYGRDIKVFTNITLVQRATMQEAEDFQQHYMELHRDVEAVDGFMNTLAAESGLPKGTPQFEVMRRIVASGSGYPVAGDARHVADILIELSGAGIAGVLINWPDPLNGIETMVRDVFPILERAGLRRPFRAA
jgi:alkanesulfonate monooxygenase SsuD/methylene tetrahydromethanopterin reductase-like flavin-dependent oxidoreductase (luciferase family)